MAHHLAVPHTFELIKQTALTWSRAIGAARQRDLNTLASIVRSALELPEETPLYGEQLSELADMLCANSAQPSKKEEPEYPLRGYFQSIQELKAFHPEADGGVCAVAASENGDVVTAYFNGNADRGSVGNFVASFVYVNEWTVTIRSFKY